MARLRQECTPHVDVTGVRLVCLDAVSFSNAFGQVRFGDLAGIAQHPRSPLVVIQVYIAARIYRHLFAPVDRRTMGASVFRQTRTLGRNEIPYLLWQPGIADVEDS